MNSKDLVLLRALLRSTSQFNILKYTDDRKKRGRITGNMVGIVLLYILLVGLFLLNSLGLGIAGLEAAIPMVCGLGMCAVSFGLTLFKSNGYLFNFKEYDMLMSLPFEAKTIAADRFIYMYIKSIPWYGSVSIASLICYGYFARPSLIVYPIWLILSALMPVIPMLAASFIGFLIAKISSGFRKTNIVQTVLITAFVVFCFSLQFIIKAIMKNGPIDQTMEAIADAVDSAGAWYPPCRWFTAAVTDLNILQMILLIGVSALLFELVFVLVGRSYRQINSALRTHGSAKAFEMTSQKSKGIVNSIAFKEFRRMTGSSTYMTNAAMGEILAFLLGVAVLFVGVDKLLKVVTEGAPVTAEMMFPAIPLIVYFFIGMVPTTVCSPSLEGKNYWIIKSLPLESKVLYQGKMLFNMYLTVPFMAFSTVCFCISAKTPVIDMVIFLIEGLILCGFSTAWGCVCGMKHMRLDWENEVEVIKQGPAVVMYLFPNMFATMALVVAVVALGMKIDPKLVSMGICIVMALLAVLSYKKVISLSRTV